jgi:hypothetical protein
VPDFEASFGDFIERREYDKAESALFSMIRIAFTAGWLAAGGNPPKPQKIVELYRPARTIPLANDPDGIETDIGAT